jgi:hypothetical protein
MLEETANPTHCRVWDLKVFGMDLLSRLDLENPHTAVCGISICAKAALSDPWYPR